MGLDGCEVRLCDPCARVSRVSRGKKTPGGAGTYTEHTRDRGHAGAHKGTRITPMTLTTIQTHHIPVAVVLCAARQSVSQFRRGPPRSLHHLLNGRLSSCVARARPLPDCVDSGQVFRGQGLPGLAMLAPLALIYQSVTQSVISRSRPARARSPLRPRLSVRLRRSRSNISTEYIVLAPGGYSIIASEVILSQRAGWSLRAFCTLLLGLYTGTHESVSLISRSSPCSRPSPVRCRTSVRRAFALHARWRVETGFTPALLLTNKDKYFTQIELSHRSPSAYGETRDRGIKTF